MTPRRDIIRWLTLLVVLGACLPTASASAAAPTKLYIGQAARLTAQIPASWSVDPLGTFDDKGPDGFVISRPGSSQTLAGACAALATSSVFDRAATVTTTTWAGHAACRLAGRIQGHAAAALVVPHPHPFTIFGERFTYAALIADPAHFASIVATLDFSPDPVTPVAFIMSVIDIMQARAYWANKIDWPLVRQQALASVNGLTTLEQAQGAVLDTMQWLRAAGDNHSLLLLPGHTSDLAEVTGYGMLVGGQRVLVVFPGGPADRAGIRVDDVIEQVDGQPFQISLDAVDPAAISYIDPAAQWPLTAQLTLRRPRHRGTIAVTVTQGSYNRYVPPTGRRLAANLGYLVVPHFAHPGPTTDYVTTGTRAVAAVDAAPTCGWVIDLRLNDGGDYHPMITILGSILGNGPFIGWRRNDGRQTWVTYQDGRIIDNGTVAADYLAGQPLYQLRQPAPPVAVLVGHKTASSGEATAIAFIGRPNTRFFGQPTAGFTTANRPYNLFDGSQLLLAESAMTDRTGATHLPNIVPTQEIATDWMTYGTAQDSVLAAAQAWLRQQPACKAMHPATPAARSRMNPFLSAR